MTETGRYKRILVPLDGSGWSARAIPHAVDIARSNGSDLILLHVFRPPTYEYTDQLALAGQEAQIDALKAQMQSYLAGVRSELQNEKLNVEIEIIEDNVMAAAICDYIASAAIDLVVMSTHGRTGIARFLMGSVAHQVMQCAGVPVLLIRPDHE